MPESEATIGWRIKKRLGGDSNGDNDNDTTTNNSQNSQNSNNTNSNSNNNHLQFQYSGVKDTTKESNKLMTTPPRIMKSNGNDTNDNSNNQSKYSRIPFVSIKDKKIHNKIEGGHSSSCSCSSATCGSCCCSNTVGTADTRRSSTGSVSVDVPLGSEDSEYDDHRGENYIDKRFNNNSSNATTTTNNNNGNNSSLSASVLKSCSASSPLQSSSLSTVTCFSTTSSSSHQRRRRSCRSRRRSRSRSCSRSSIGSLHSIDSCTTTTTSISGSANSSWNGMDTDKDFTDHEKCLQSNNNNTCSDYYQLQQQQQQHHHHHQHQENQSQQQKQKQLDWFTKNNICCRINNWYCRTNNRTITLLFGTIGIYTSFVLHGNIQEELFLYRSFHHHHNHHHESDGNEEEPEAFTYVWLLQVLESIASIILGLIGSYIWTQHEHHSKQQQHQKQYPTLSSSLVTDSDTMVNVTATTSATTTESTTTEQTKTTRKLPIGTLFCVGMTQVLSKGCTCLALSTGVSYPVCTITKCGKIIPVMIGQLLLGGSKYTMKDYIFCILIVSGITLVSYNTSENDTNKESTPSSVSNRNDRNSKVGLIFLFLSLVLDGCTAGLQKRMQQQQQPDERKHQQQQQQEHYHHYQQEDESNPTKVDSTNVTTRVNIADGSSREYDNSSNVDNSNNVVNNNHDDDNTNTTKKGLMIPQNTKQPEADMILYQTPTMYDFLLYSHCSMLVVALWISIMTNEFIPGILYSMYNPMIRSLLEQVCICSVIGQGFIFYIITKFDTYVCTAITTTRKLVSIGISIVVHGHVIPQSGYIGMILVGTALLLELEYKKNSK